VFSHIVLGVDGSEVSSKGVDVAAGLAATLQARVTVVHALVDPMMVMPPVAPTEAMITPPLLSEDALAELEKAGREIVGAAVDRLRQAGVTAEGRLERGPAGAQIVQTARTAGADLIILGSRGHGKLEELLLGSVSDAVVREAPCSVLIVR